MNNLIRDKITAKPSGMGSYSENDVIFLLKNIGELVTERGNKERERAMQSGKHYSEMLPIEYKPSQEYIDLFYSSLKEYSKKIAIAVGVVAELILKKKGKDLVFASLARAGTPAGILIKRYIKQRYAIDIPHYSISIIRDRGIDENAIIYILQNHPDAKIQFIDGWTGKGAITRELIKSCDDFYNKYGIKLDNDMAVIADPGYCVNLYGTRDDFLIPSSCLNSTVSGLVSRTVLRDDLIDENDFHGAKYYKELDDEDLSELFIDTISKEFKGVYDQIMVEVEGLMKDSMEDTWIGLGDVEKIQEEFGIENINFIKPGIGETTRVLLRRVPWKILVKDFDEKLKHILVLAEEKGVVVEKYSLSSYSCCGLIKNMGENNDIRE